MCVGPSFCACGSKVNESPGIDHFKEAAYEVETKLEITNTKKILINFFILFPPKKIEFPSNTTKKF